LRSGNPYKTQILCLSDITLHRLRVFENRMLRKMFGSRTDEVTAEWRKLHKEELYDLYCSPSKVIPRLTKIIRSGITFVSRNVISRRFL